MEKGKSKNNNKYGNKNEDKEMLTILNETIHMVTQDYEKYRFNSAIAKIREFTNIILEKENELKSNNLFFKEIIEAVIKLLSPITPHIAEELWEINGRNESVFLETYPKYDLLLAEEDIVTIAIQINGKLRGNIEVEKTINKDALLNAARNQGNVIIHLKNKKIIKEIVVPGRLVNFVVQ